LKVSTEPAEVRPRNTTGSSRPTTIVKVTYRETGDPAPNFLVRLSAESVQYGGGHMHNGNRPIGIFDQSSGRTGSNGIFTTRYTQTEFGGFEVIKASVDRQPPVDEETYDLKVRFPGLVELGAGTGYTLIGETTSHPRNHYGTTHLINCIQKLGSLFTKSFPNQTLRINDISLEWGGLFDINGNWYPPHETHREGIHVDVDDKTAEGEKVDKIWLKNIVTKKLDGEFRDEINHFHLTFKGGKK